MEISRASAVNSAWNEGCPKSTINPYSYFGKSEISTIFNTQRGRNGIPAYLVEQMRRAPRDSGQAGRPTFWTAYQFDLGVSCAPLANSGQPERDPATGRRDPQFDLGVSCAPLANSGQIGTNVSSSCDASFASASCACGSPSCGVCASYHLALRPPLFILNEWTRVLLEKLLRLLTNFAAGRRESNRFLEPFVCFLYVSGPEIHNAQIEVPLHMLRIVL